MKIIPKLVNEPRTDLKIELFNADRKNILAKE